MPIARLTVFETGPFDHSGKSPWYLYVCSYFAAAFMEINMEFFKSNWVAIGAIIFIISFVVLYSNTLPKPQPEEVEHTESADRERPEWISTHDAGISVDHIVIVYPSSGRSSIKRILDRSTNTLCYESRHGISCRDYKAPE